MSTALLFPGQGSQKVGMGSDLFDKFQGYTQKADDILGYSIKELCLEDKNKLLNITSHTQPALFVVSALAYLDWKENGGNASFAAGHSVGEYAALFSSGAIDFETGVQWVKKRGELMAQVSGGGMAAVVGMTVDKVKNVLDKEKSAKIDVANYNSPEQTVISGPSELIADLEDDFKDAGAKMYAILKVSGAFHSRYMEDSAKEFATYIEDFKVSDPDIPVISNVEATPYLDASSIKGHLVSQISSSVRWTETILYLRDKGVVDFVELGSGNVLTKLLRKI